MSSGPLITLMSNYEKNAEVCETIVGPAIEISKWNLSGTLKKYGDFCASNVGFHIKVPSYVKRPYGFPYLFIDEIIFKVEEIPIPILQCSGKSLWCSFQSYSDDKRRSIELASKHGMIMLGDMLPSLSILSSPCDTVTWNIKINEDRYEDLLKNNSQVLDIAANGVEDVAKIMMKYAKSCNDSITPYIPYIYYTKRQRDKIIKDLKFTQYPRYIYFEFPVNLEYELNIPYETSALQFNVLIERPDSFLSFYTPDETPLKEFTLRHRSFNTTIRRGDHTEMYIMDKFTHNIYIPQHVALYTHTLQTFQNFESLASQVSNFNGIRMNGISTLNLKNINIKITTEDHIPSSAKVCLLMLCVGTIQYSAGALSVK